jgi:protein-S-isoprenylcysteine O-methyltransferase Ste14
MNKQKFVSPVLMWIIIFIGIILLIYLIPDKSLFKRNFFSISLFLMSIIYWIYFFLSSIYIHKKAIYSAYKIDKIIKSGTYSIVRHPIYSADIVLGIGIFLFIPRIDVIISIMWMIFILLFWMKLEEKSLEKRFGKEYLEYKKQVPMLIPRII